MNKRLLFYGVILLQVLFLVTMTASYYAIDMFGKEVKLKIEPIDPRDIFYGDYVILNYTITTVPKTLWLDSEEPLSGDIVYVVLEQQGEFHDAKSVSYFKPEISPGEVLLKGRYLYDFDGSDLFIEYGIERYFVEEGTGKAIEEQRSEMEALVKIAPWGQMKIDKINTR